MAITPSVKISLDIPNGAVTAKAFEDLQKQVAGLEGKVIPTQTTEKSPEVQRINFYNELPEKSEATPAATGSLTVLQDPLNQKKRKRRAQRNNPEVP